MRSTAALLLLPLSLLSILLVASAASIAIETALVTGCTACPDTLFTNSHILSPRRPFTYLSSPLLLSCVSLSPASTVSAATASSNSTAAAMSCNDFAHITRQPRQSDEQYRKQLTPQQFYCSRQAGTERPGTGPLLHNKQKGVYTCVSCGAPLFDSATKFESGTGWPSFYDKLGDNVKEKVDVSHGMRRVEVTCAACDGHLGHVFDDGPSEKTGLRYCINSASMAFVADEAGGTETELVDHDNVCAVPSKK